MWEHNDINDQAKVYLQSDYLLRWLIINADNHLTKSCVRMVLAREYNYLVALNWIFSFVVDL